MFRHSCNFPYYFDDSDYENNGYGRCGRDRGCPGSFEPYNCCRPGPIGPRGCPGPIGPVGPTGAAGLDGLDGATGPAGTELVRPGQRVTAGVCGSDSADRRYRGCWSDCADRRYRRCGPAAGWR
ncbi:MAG: hypothetical protein ACLTR6_01510 [Clostridium fessum]